MITLFTKALQIAIVLKDLDEVVKTNFDLFIFEFGPG